MAKSGVVEGDPTMVARAVELKKELQKLVKAILDEHDDVNLEAVDRALKTLSDLKELKLEKSVSLKHHNHHCDVISGAVPEEFKCPLSKELMRDPVVIASGQTFERSFIQKWLKSGNRTCPRTHQVLSHSILTPNHLIQLMISQWCKDHGIILSDSLHHTNEDVLTEADRDHFLSLLNKITSSTLSNQKEAAKELRLLTKQLPSFRAHFGESPDAIPQLLSPLCRSNNELHPQLQEDLITTLLNLSIHDNNKKLVGEMPMVIPVLIDALTFGTIETRRNAAAAIFTLSALDSNKALLGKSGALKPLIDLMDEGHPSVMRDVASAIFNLCIIHENKERAVRDGVLGVIFKKIGGRVVNIDELLSIVAMFTTNQEAIEEMGELGAVSCLLGVIRETHCGRVKENCIAVLYAICFSDRSKLKEMREEEDVYGTVSQLAQNGTSRAKRKANAILQRINRPPLNHSHSA